MTDEQIEEALAKLPGERVTEAAIKSRIKSVEYQRFPEGGTMTVCAITLDSGYISIGTAACADPANFREEIGRELAYRRAFNALWPLFGFALAERLHMLRVLRERLAAAEPPPEGMTVEGIARICHEANRALCAATGDRSQPAWHDAPNWQRQSAIDGVRFHIANPEASASASHDNWLAHKRAEGWSWGPMKRPEIKQHPCMVEFDRLPPEQQAKDHLFRAIVHALAPFMRCADDAAWDDFKIGGTA